MKALLREIAVAIAAPVATEIAGGIRDSFARRREESAAERAEIRALYRGTSEPSTATAGVPS